MTIKEADVDSAPAPGARRVVIVGYGGMGALLAAVLAEAGHRVRVMDTDRRVLESRPLPTDLQGSITPVLGDGTSERDLRKASIRNADVLIATTGSDAINALSAQMAVTLFDIQSVVCRYDEPSGRAMYQGKLGITAVSSTELATSAIVDAIRGG